MTVLKKNINYVLISHMKQSPCNCLEFILKRHKFRSTFRSKTSAKTSYFVCMTYNTVKYRAYAAICQSGTEHSNFFQPFVSFDIKIVHDMIFDEMVLLHHNCYCSFVMFNNKLAGVA